MYIIIKGHACTAAQFPYAKLFKLLPAYKVTSAASSTACTTETRSPCNSVHASRRLHAATCVVAHMHTVLTSESMTVRCCTVPRSCMQVTVLQRAFRAARDAGGKQPSERRLTLSTSFRGGSRSSRNAATAAAAAATATATSAVAGTTG
jgi:hypothetical protein